MQELVFTLVSTRVFHFWNPGSIPAFDRQFSSTLIDFELVQILMRVDESFRYVRGNIQSTLMQLLFSFDRGMRVEKTLMQTSCFSDSTLMQTLASQISCKLSLLNSHQLSCNSCSRLTRTRELRKLSCKLSLLNSHQLSCKSCSRLTGTWELRKLSCKLLASLTLLWCKLSLLKSHANSRFSTLMQLLFSFDRVTRVGKLSCKLSLLNSHSCLTRP
jgi:hypothetical protein